MAIPFQALEISLEVIRSLKKPVGALRCRDRKLHDEIRRAASSAALNLGEGNRRVGKDRLHHFRIAAGSAAETRTALRVAAAWGDVTESEIREPLELLDRLLAILWRLSH